MCVTGQHREMLDQVLEAFEVVPDADLALMEPAQTLAGLTSRTIAAVDAYLAEERPDLVVVQGDTTTVFCAALAAFYRGIPVGHVEAGLRTWDKRSPFPEEVNRVLTSRLADLYFAPTETSRRNLLREGVPDRQVHVTGNTVIDALLLAAEKVRRSPPRIAGLPDSLQPAAAVGQPAMVLITAHRRENFGRGFENICRAIAELAGRFPDIHFVYPVHPNPNVQQTVRQILGAGDIADNNIHRIDPVDYLSFVGLMNRCTLVLTDSGGIQEEAPSLGKPVLVMRDLTERPEAVEMGTARLVGTDRRTIVDGVSELLTCPHAYSAMANAVNPYGDGKACQRIVAAIEAVMGLSAG